MAKNRFADGDGDLHELKRHLHYASLRHQGDP